METATLENPVLKEEELDKAFMEAAEAADRGDDIQLPSTPTDGTRAPVVEPEKPAETSSTDTTPETKDERPRDELGRFTKTPDGVDIPVGDREAAPTPDKTAEEGKPESAYAKAQKDQERLNRNRQEFEQEKARERDQLAQERQQIAKERDEWFKQRQPQGQQNGQQQPQPSSLEYAEFAKAQTEKARKLRLAGDDDGADEAAELATKATEAALNAHQSEQAQYQEQAATQGQANWEREMQERIREQPELAKGDTPLAKETMTVMQAYPGVFERIPPIRLPSGKIVGGFGFAAEVAQLRLKAGAASVLEQENKKLKAENDRLNGLTGMDGGGPTSPINPRTFEQMSSEEQTNYLNRQAARIDAGQ